ncbi:MAG TPA: DUF4157 domain-containing protein [Chloroflexia bacterium]
MQTKSLQGSDVAGTPAPPIVHDVLRSPGQPLDPATRGFMETRFGHDFSKVRVHDGSQAAASARAVQARAYTLGQHVVFGAGQYAPRTFEGRRLVAHELTHVLQQGGGKSVIRRKLQFDTEAYMPENPISKFLRLRTGSSRPVGYTTPTFNGIPLEASPVAGTKPKSAGQIILDALSPKFISYNSSAKECAYADFEARVSANVIIASKPGGTGWTMDFPRSDIGDPYGATACKGSGTVPVIMTGTPSSMSVYEQIKKNEIEHVTDLKKLCAKHLEKYFDGLLLQRGKGKDEKACQADLTSKLGNQDSRVAEAFIKDWLESVNNRDKAGGHTFGYCLQKPERECHVVKVNLYGKGDKCAY